MSFKTRRRDKRVFRTRDTGTPEEFFQALKESNRSRKLLVDESYRRRCLSGKSEEFCNDEIEEMIELNRSIVQRRGQDFESDNEDIYGFFTALAIYDNIDNRRTRIVRKAGHILGGLAWHQYFNEGNKETAYRMTVYYLRKNGFSLPLKSKRERKELYDLLVKTIEKFPQDQTIYSEVAEYLDRKVI